MARIDLVRCDNCGKELPATTPDMVHLEVERQTWGFPIPVAGQDFCSLVCLYKWAEKATRVERQQECA